MTLNVFRPSLDSEDHDPLLGGAVAGQYRIMQFVHADEYSRLYVGLDITEDATIGIRIAKDKQSHAKMLEWLAWAMMTTGKHAILAMGHLDRSRLFYVVLSEAALDIIRQPQKPELEPLRLAASDG